MKGLELEPMTLEFLLVENSGDVGKGIAEGGTDILGTPLTGAGGVNDFRTEAPAFLPRLN